METKENKEMKEVREAAETELSVSAANKRAKKKERREAKAARKAANQVEEKKKRPNNIVLGIMIFGILIVMFGAVKCYTYFSKDASLEAYIENNKEQYQELSVDQVTTANVTAKGNSMKVALNATVEDSLADELTEYYEGDDGSEQLKYIGSYFLTTAKPLVRGFSADVETTITVNDKEIGSEKLTYKEAKDFLEELQNKAEEAADKEQDDAGEAQEDDGASADSDEEAED